MKKLLTPGIVIRMPLWAGAGRTRKIPNREAIDAGVEQFTFRTAGITREGRRELSEPYVLSRAKGSPAVKLKIPLGMSTMPGSTEKIGTEP